MSRVFRRPMFRKGGSTNMNGIMSGITDREDFQQGSTADRLIAAAGESRGIDPLSQFLIQGGLNLAAGPATGSVIRDIATAAKQPTTDLFKSLEQRDAEKRKLRLLGEEMDIRKEIEQEKIADERAYGEKMLQDQRAYNKLTLEEQRSYDAKLLDEARNYAKMDLADKREYEQKLIEEGRAFDLQKIQMQIDAESPTSQASLTASFLDTYEGSKNQATNRAIYETENIEASMGEKFGQNNAGLIGGNVHGNFTDQIKSKNVGKVYYDVTDGKVKQVTRNSEGEIGFKVINLDNYDPDTSQATTGKKESFPGEFSENPGYRRPPKEFNIPEADPFDPESA